MGASNASSVDNGNFANNAFSDFAPLLTLFGDETTKQFLATSMGMADNVLLSIAPLGIMTIIVSAIRVGGNGLMKSLIGRARDSPDDEEKEILSSTSANVREIWDGNRVVRQTGISKTIPLVLHPDSIEDPNVDSQFNSQSRLRHLSKTSLTYDVIRGMSGMSGRSVRTKHLPFIFSDNTPPSMTLNGDGVVPGRWTVIVFALFGLLVQVAVMVINALVVYRWRWLRASKIVAPYGYPTWAVGTATIAIGSCICGWVIESSSWKLYLRRPENTKAIFFQKAISELNIPPYMIEQTKPGSVFILSRRQWPQTSEPYLRWHDDFSGEARDREFLKREILTMLGTGLTLCGFVCQNIGTRELHWSAGFLQLGATLILTLLRAWLRRKVGDSLEKAANITELERGFEACDFATRITQYSCYMPLFSPLSLYRRETIYPVPEGMEFTDIGIPMVGCSLVADLIKKGPSYSGIISNLLKTQDLIAEYEPALDEAVKMATSCFMAMKEVLKTICKDGKSLRHLGDFIYLVLTPQPQDEILGIDTIGFSPAQSDQEDIKLLLAIISLTHFANRDVIGRSQTKILRILGYYSGGDVEAHVNLLNAWIDTPMEILLRTFDWDDERYPPIGLLPQSHTDFQVFGLPLSYAFQRLQTAESAYVPKFELIKSENDAVITNEVIVKNIALDLISSFMVRVATRFEAETMEFIHSNPAIKATKCGTLVDILIRHGVCRSEVEGQLAVVPALINCGILSLAPGIEATTKQE